MRGFVVGVSVSIGAGIAWWAFWRYVAPGRD